LLEECFKKYQQFYKHEPKYTAAQKTSNYPNDKLILDRLCKE